MEISVRWVSRGVSRWVSRGARQWFTAVVEAWDPDTDEHFVAYHDGTMRWYDLPDKHWKVLHRSRLSWHPHVTSHLLALGTHDAGLMSRTSAGTLYTLPAVTYADSDSDGDSH